ncbi:sugar phosphate isomerase/epimerase family protein [Candidatus Chloroploca asiatica]|uniref:Xylose isomerase-like TIM barrel domain-containing protein n=1 Tax=Candidatus Chloroploca asiatica TaxID=1506545 RepID=A0A2H3KNF6_9CHLR|nr:TIM barrel protein [Candidatus Chloroploca asiatica]PDV99687.1 hypothetical protein A9Q02_00245 [Candidatus Chloroploca asiatica]
MQLGIRLEIHPGDDLSRVADMIASRGFGALHAHFPEGCDRSLARRLGRACAHHGLSVDAISGYANPLRPDEAPMGSTFEQLLDLIDLLPLLDARRIVSWSGSFGPGLFDEHPDNHGELGWQALQQSVEDLFPVLDDAEAILVLDPYYTHVLSHPNEVARFCAEINSPYVRVMLDPPGMLPPENWDHQAELIPLGVRALTPYVGMIQFRDMRLKHGAFEDAPPGHGVLDYRAFVQAIQASELSVPMFISHTPLDQAAAARRFVLDYAHAVQLR